MDDSIFADFNDEISEAKRVAEEEKMAMNAVGEGGTPRFTIEIEEDPAPPHGAQEGEFSFADMMAQDEAIKKKHASTVGSTVQIGEGEFSFADMMAQDEAIKKKHASTVGPTVQVVR